MRAIAVNQYGAGPTLMDLPKPKPGPHQILIKVRDAGVNPMDRQMSNGRLQARMPATFPLVLGADLAGEEESVGENTTRFATGDLVVGHRPIAPLCSAAAYPGAAAISRDGNLAPLPRPLS